MGVLNKIVYRLKPKKPFVTLRTFSVRLGETMKLFTSLAPSKEGEKYKHFSPFGGAGGRSVKSGLERFCISWTPLFNSNLLGVLNA